VRIIAATNRNLEEMIKNGEFREDLFYRLNVLPILLPPLRERKDDIPPLVNYFMDKFNNVHGKKITGVSDQTQELFQKYNWPGNIRELENVIERAFVMEGSDQITPSSLPDNILESGGLKLSSIPAEAPAAPSTTANPFSGEVSTSGDSIAEKYVVADEEGKFDFQTTKEKFERDFIVNALKSYGGRINKTALHANIPKKTLLRKIEKYGINTDEFKTEV
jgi:transcriptional regulator with PAS, ATPase and Fis domain